MAQVSSKQVDKKQWDLMWKKVVDLVSGEMSRAEAETVLSGFLSETERTMLVKRLMVWVLLRSGWSVPAVSCVMNLSSATVYKFKAMFELNAELNRVMEKKFGERVKVPEGRVGTEELVGLVEDYLMAAYRKKYPEVFGD